ncbi:peroxidase 55-like [Silene latifolia]|uniref:peroxidase 55-like n=1 Tax=Silene latifolia TaxID=37657 RepID=UPI003D77440D
MVALLKNVCKIMMIIVMIIGVGKTQLSENFYRFSCPFVEPIVRQAVSTKFSQTSVTAQATIRLFFHDCFVEGCDASIMIFSANGDAEKDAPINLSLAGDGFDTVNKAKQAVEAVCPGVVSCADILALATRDSVFLAGGPSYNVELGRRDGLSSKATDVTGKLPEPEFNLAQLVSMFAKHNLTQTDMIALSGAHTIGASHCSKFASRVSNFSSSNEVDPSMDPSYAQNLQQQCSKNKDPNFVVFMETQTPTTFDNLYYQDLVAGRGLFTSDQVLYTDQSSRPTVVNFANSERDFDSAFVSAIRQLGRVGVKTGNQGEIRRNCAAFNS